MPPRLSVAACRPAASGSGHTHPKPPESHPTLVIFAKKTHVAIIESRFHRVSRKSVQRRFALFISFTRIAQDISEIHASLISDPMMRHDSRFEQLDEKRPRHPQNRCRPSRRNRPGPQSGTRVTACPRSIISTILVSTSYRVSGKSTLYQDQLTKRRAPPCEEADSVPGLGAPRLPERQSDLETSRFIGSKPIMHSKQNAILEILEALAYLRRRRRTREQLLLTKVWTCPLYVSLKFTTQ